MGKNDYRYYCLLTDLDPEPPAHHIGALCGDMDSAMDQSNPYVYRSIKEST